MQWPNNGVNKRGFKVDNVMSNAVLVLVVKEKTNREIAEELKMSEKNVEKIIKKLFNQFKVKSRVGLTREYMKELKTLSL